MIPNARFWEYVNGDWVKMTLKFGQTVQWSKFQDTDEGWDFQGCTWEHEGEVVRYSSSHNALDCDGRFDRYCDFECLLPELKARELAASIYSDSRTEFEKTLLLPCWIEAGYSQRDHSAEAMGY